MLLLLSILNLALVLASNEVFPSPFLAKDSIKRMLSIMDSSFDPCTDFYKYSCNGFTNRYANRDTNERMKSIISQHSSPLAMTRPEKDIFFKTRDYYLSCANRKAIEARGFEPLAALSRTILSKFNSHDMDLPLLFGSLQIEGARLLFNIKYGKIETRDPDDLRLQFFPEPGFEVPKSTVRKVLSWFVDAKVLKNTLNLDKVVDGIMHTERKVYNFVSRLNGVRKGRPIDSEDQFMSLETLSDKTGLDWSGVLSSFKITPRSTKVHMWGGTKPWLRIFKHFKSLSTESLSHYTLWRLVSHFPQLSSKYVSYYYSSVHLFQLTPEQPHISTEASSERESLDCVAQTGRQLPYLSGSLFLRDAFDASRRNSSKILIDTLFVAFKERLENLEWMDTMTRSEALKKLNAMQRVIGFPEWAFDAYQVAKLHKPLRLNPRQYFENTIQTELFKMYSPVIHQTRSEILDRQVFYGIAWDLNAFHLTDLVQIQINAGLLQPPLLSTSQALTYGSIGSLISHEIVHGFDTIGSKLDHRGVQRQWMSMGSKGRLMDRSRCFVKLFDGLEGRGRGMKTLAEDIADIGGISNSFQAFKNGVGGSDIGGAGGLTEDQMFFLGFGQMWCSTRKDSKGDVHAWNRDRAAGVMQIGEFGEAFGCSKRAVCQAY